MKERLLELIRAADSPVHGRNLAREYLQARILAAMQDAGAMIPLAFQGGTALRFLYDLPRFSEDLDFALERPERGDYDFQKMSDRALARLRREGYEVSEQIRTDGVVECLMVRFHDLLHEGDLPPRVTERLRIRVEVDTRPPEGAVLATTVVRRHVLLNLQHHDRASLLAGKLHAVLQRTWTRGRDLFDLFWYLSDRRWPGPNLTLLNNVLTQTGWEGPDLQESTWRGVVEEKVGALDWDTARADVEPFLEPGPHTDLFTREHLLGLLASAG
ncbi:MAG: nucleotidyl transferase AbiEii/AbiGii toxin family protein [bacterium]